MKIELCSKLYSTNAIKLNLYNKK